MDIQFLYYYVPSLAILAAWAFLKQKTNSRRFLVALWIVVLLVLGAYGTRQWRDFYQFSRLQIFLSYSSNVWFSGPVLIWTVAKPSRYRSFNKGGLYALVKCETDGLKNIVFK